MVLLYITNQVCGAAGLERVLSIKARLLAETYNYDVHIITLNQGDTPLFYDFGNAITFHDITLPSQPLGYIYNYVKQLKQKVKAIQPDIISVCDDGLKGLLLAKILGKPCAMIYERHVSKNIIRSTTLTQKLKFFISNKLMHYGGTHYDKFVVLTTGNLKEWNLKNLQVVNNPLSFYDNVPKSNLDSKIVLAVGRHDYQKGYDRLLKIWQKLYKNHPDWQLHIYGKKNEALGLETMADNFGLGNSIAFFDPVKDISSVYKNAAIYVMSSRFEGFGMVLTEAMIHGVPAITFDCPYGPSDIVDHNQNGALIPNGDINTFAEHLERLMKDDALRETLGTNAIGKALEFHPNKIIQQWDSLFKTLVS